MTQTKERNNRDKKRFYLTYGNQGTGDYRDTWQVFQIMAEFVTGYQFLSNFTNKKREKRCQEPFKVKPSSKEWMFVN